MASTKRPTKSKPAAKKKGAAGRPAAAKSQPAKSAPKKAATRGESSKVAISPLTGLPVREKIHLPIKGYGRLNAFEVLENLYSKTPAQLKQILAYEEKHQARRMVIDRINDMLRRAGIR